MAPAAPALAHAIVARAMADGDRGQVSAAVVGSTVVGLLVSRWADDAPRRDLLALGVAPAWRRQGLATALLAAHGSSGRSAEADDVIEVTLAERDVLEPLEPGTRAAIAARLLSGAGFHIEPAEAAVRRVDPLAVRAWRPLAPGAS